MNCSTTSDPKPIQKVTIADMWVGNLIDNDNDGYYSFYNLYFDLDVNQGSREVFFLFSNRFDVAGD